MEERKDILDRGNMEHKGAEAGKTISGIPGRVNGQEHWKDTLGPG